MTKSRRGDQWKDPARRAQASEAMRAAWDRRRYFTLTWPNGTEVQTHSLEDVANYVHRRPATVKVYLAKNRGTVTFTHDGENIVVQRIYR